MEEHLRKHDGEIAEVRDILVRHIADEAISVPALRGEINGQLKEIRRILHDQNVMFIEHKNRVEPYLQGATGLGFIWKFFVAIASIAVAYTQIKNFHL